MAKTTAPLLSIGATGSFAKTAVFSKWRGIRYARQHVIPANPNTSGQQATRNVFRTTSEMWKLMGSIAISPWDAFATGRQFLGRNAFMGQNTGAMRGEVDMDLMIGSPGARGGLPPLTLVAGSVAAGGIEAVYTAPTPPTGWTLTGGQAIVYPDQDPAAAFTATISEDEDLVAAGTIDFTGLATVNHQVRLWLKWLKPDAQIAYSAALADQILVT